MEKDQLHIDVTIEIAPEGIVGIRPEGTNGGRKRRNIPAKHSALCRSGIANLGLIHAVFPYQVVGHIGGSPKLQIVSKRKAVFPLFPFAVQGFGLNLKTVPRFVVRTGEFGFEFGDFLFCGLLARSRIGV